MKQEKERLTPEEGAERILDYARKSLGRAAPPLLPALYLLRNKPVEVPCGMHTDGKHLYYHPAAVVADFRKDRKEPIRQLLHITIHGIMGHIGKARGYREEAGAFDRAADRNVQDVLRFAGEELNDYVPELWDWLGLPYRSLEEHLAADEEGGEVPTVDDHSLWRAEGTEADGGEEIPGEAAAQWQEAGRLVLEGLRTMGGTSWDILAGALEKALEPDRRRGISYRALLEELCLPRTAPEEDLLSLDPILYQVGLDLLEDHPLVEPGEESERAVRGNLVVAVDTSGSCSGAVAQRFLGETLQVLESLRGRWRGKLALLQCDSKIQSARVLEDLELDPEGLAECSIFRGGGGTDFHPVFRWVKKWREETGEDVLGLLLFTDGWGDFPRRAPGYPVVVLLDEEKEDGWSGFGSGGDYVPNWARKYRLKEDLEL